MNAPSTPRLTLDFDASVYRLSAVKKAAYRFGDRCFVQIDVPAEDCIRVTLDSKTPNQASSDLEGEFRNEVLDQELREQVAGETERIRNLLLAQAFSGVSLTDSVGDSADYRTDPLGIVRSPSPDQ